MSTEPAALREPARLARHWPTVAPVASAAIVLLFGAIAYSGARREDASIQVVAHTDSVIAANAAVLMGMGDHAVNEEMAVRLRSLRALVADSPREQALVDSIQNLLSHNSRAALDSARRISAAIEAREQQLLAAQNADQDDHERTVRWIVAIGSFVAAGLALLIGLTLSHSARTNAHLAVEAHALNEELQVINEQLEDRTAEAEEANKAKARFLANMSHDLRTPLNAIIGYADLLDVGARGAVTPEQREDLRRIKRSGQHLTSLINDVLDFAKIEAGRLRLRVEAVSVKRVLSDVEALVAPQIRTTGLDISYRCDSDLLVRADREKLDQILVNLVGNAIKFTAPGGHIDVEAVGDGAQARLAVRDTGRGIPSGELESVFEPFVQVDPLRVPNGQKGVGLGLAISRELARAMSGDLTVSSAPGEGSTFTVRLERAA
jgi:signal transduction histidine kinase